MTLNPTPEILVEGAQDEPTKGVESYGDICRLIPIYEADEGGHWA